MLRAYSFNDSLINDKWNNNDRKLEESITRETRSPAETHASNQGLQTCAYVSLAMEARMWNRRSASVIPPHSVTHRPITKDAIGRIRDLHCPIAVVRYVLDSGKSSVDKARANARHSGCRRVEGDSCVTFDKEESSMADMSRGSLDRLTVIAHICWRHAALIRRGEGNVPWWFLWELFRGRCAHSVSFFSPPLCLDQNDFSLQNNKSRTMLLSIPRETRHRESRPLKFYGELFSSSTRSALELLWILMPRGALSRCSCFSLNLAKLARNVSKFSKHAYICIYIWK